MIPRIPGCKTVIFQPKVTVYHQTFSPLGKANALFEKGGDDT